MKRLVAALFVLACFVTAAPADDWPSRPVRIINTFAPGGAADQLARLAADQLSTAYKQQFFVETRAGAAGVIGMQAVAAAEPDGYTFGIMSMSLGVIIPLTNPNAGYDPTKDLTPVAYIAGTPIMFVVSKKSDVKTLKEFVAKAKAQLEAADLWRVRPVERGADGGAVLRAGGEASSSRSFPTRAPRKA